MLQVSFDPAHTSRLTIQKMSCHIGHRRLIFLLIVAVAICMKTRAEPIDRPLSNERFYMTADEDPNDIWERYRHDSKTRAQLYRAFLRTLYDDDELIQNPSNHAASKRSKLNLHTNLNLPRYLRQLE